MKKNFLFSARYAESQVSDQLIAQHVEKVAQRRVEERNEKIRIARKARFDLKNNPFFSRPPDVISKEFARLQQEQLKTQQQSEIQRVFISSPHHALVTNQNQSLNSSMTENRIDGQQQSKAVHRRISVRATKKSLHSADEDDESGNLTSVVGENNQRVRSGTVPNVSGTNNKRTINKSASTRLLTTNDAMKIGSIKRLKLIFPANYKSKYRHLLLLDKVAYIYIQLVVMLGHKMMTGGQFRSFAKYV